VVIGSASKAAAEAMLVRELLLHLDTTPALQDATDADAVVIIKVTLPEDPTTYDALVRHPKVGLCKLILVYKPFLT
jgi:hypothetical protein